MAPSRGQVNSASHACRVAPELADALFPTPIVDEAQKRFVGSDDSAVTRFPSAKLTLLPSVTLQFEGTVIIRTLHRLLLWLTPLVTSC